MLLDSYQGQLLIAQPKCQSDFFKESVVLVAKHSSQGAWGLMLNKPLPIADFDFAELLDHTGVENPLKVNSPMFIGGPLERGRVCILHTSDYSSSSTREIVPGLSISVDMNILAAIAGGEGPKDFRAYTGISGWSAGQLDGEMRGEAPWTQQHKWLSIPANYENVMEIDHEVQWNACLEAAVRLEVREFF